MCIVLNLLPIKTDFMTCQLYPWLYLTTLIGQVSLLMIVYIIKQAYTYITNLPNDYKLRSQIYAYLSNIITSVVYHFQTLNKLNISNELKL